MSRNEMLDMIVRALGGRVAESVVLDDISTGASSDIRQATSIAKQMVTRYGMSEKLGTVLYGSEHSQDEVFLGRDFSSGKDYSEQTAAAIDDEIRRIIGDAYSRCENILKEHIDKLHFVAEFLLKNESMDDEQFRAAMEMANPTMESIEEIAVRRKEKSEQENKTAQKKNARADEEEIFSCSTSIALFFQVFPAPSIYHIRSRPSTIFGRDVPTRHCLCCHSYRRPLSKYRTV